MTLYRSCMKIKCHQKLRLKARCNAKNAFFRAAAVGKRTEADSTKNLPIHRLAEGNDAVDEFKFYITEKVSRTAIFISVS